MVGSSQKIYSLVVELCTVKFRDTDELYVGIRDASYATLRAQLLMALHDDNNPIASKDRCGPACVHAYMHACALRCLPVCLLISGLAAAEWASCAPPLNDAVRPCMDLLDAMQAENVA